MAQFYASRKEIQGIRIVLACNQIGKHKTAVKCCVHKEYMCNPISKQKH